MTKSLVVVESPTKIKTIKKYLGKDFTIAATVGHLKDLPQKEIGINIEEGFKSFYRILAPEGQVTILEFRMPKNRVFKKVYKFYFKKVLPFIGGKISGDKEAYEYLPSSVEEFDEKINLTKMLKMVGFKKVISKSLTLGIVQVIISTK